MTNDVDDDIARLVAIIRLLTPAAPESLLKGTAWDLYMFVDPERRDRSIAADKQLKKLSEARGRTLRLLSSIEEFDRSLRDSLNQANGGWFLLDDFVDRMKRFDRQLQSATRSTAARTSGKKRSVGVARADAAWNVAEKLRRHCEECAVDPVRVKGFKGALKALFSEFGIDRSAQYYATEVRKTATRR